jgi:hypothetical protein
MNQKQTMDDPLEELSRRDFLKGVTTVGAMSAFSGTTLAQTAGSPNQPFQPVAFLLGTKNDSPNQINLLAPDGEFFSGDNYEKTYYAYIYQQPNGTQWYITQDDSEWSELRMNPQTQLEEVRTENYKSFFDHTFARPNAPDTKNWDFTDADITKYDSEVELASTTTLETIQEGNYPPGTEALAGGAFRVTGTPTAGYGQMGYYNDDNGFGVGEDATDSYIFVRKNGSEFTKYRSNWNQYVPDSRVWVTDYPIITRFPHLFYGGGSINFRAVMHDGNDTQIKTLHRVTPKNTPGGWSDGPPFGQPNLPIRFESSNLSGGSVRGNAAHYEIGGSQAEIRVNGTHFTGIDAGTTDWTPLMSWRKRSGWNMVNVKPLKLAISAVTNDAKLELQIDPVVSGQTWSLPVHTSTAETAVEVTQNGNQGSIDTDGERRWPGYAVAGKGSAGGQSVDDNLNFNLPADRVVTLAAQGVGGTSTLSGVVGWEEYF